MKNVHVHLVDLGDTDYPNQSPTGISGPDGVMLSLTNTGPALISFYYEQLSVDCFYKIVIF